MNGGLTLHIPLPYSYPQRGGKLNVDPFVIANSKVWQVQTHYPPSGAPSNYWNVNYSPWGNTYLTDALHLGITRSFESIVDFYGNTTESVSHYAFIGPSGESHPISAISTSNGQEIVLESSNVTGYRIELAGTPDSYGVYPSARIIDRNGNVYTLGAFVPHSPAPGVPKCTVTRDGVVTPTDIATEDPEPYGTTTDCNELATVTSVADSNGNTVYENVFYASTSTDTEGRPISVPQSPVDACAAYNYPGPSNSTQPITYCSTTISLQTNFGLSDVTEFQNSNNNGSHSTSIISSITLPDQTSWNISYDNYGEITQVTLPLGGSISYQWTTIPLPQCNTQTPVSRAVSTRTISDGKTA
jgi:hypothetical protein